MIPRVYAAIGAITAAFARHGIAKERLNLADDYAYRSIDDVLVRLAPLLAEHKLCVLPRVLEREVTERAGTGGELLLSVAIKAAYDLVSLEDGSSHTVEAWGEALDPSDKGTAKAMQSAYKYAVIQAFAIPVTGSEDADAKSPRLSQPDLTSQPVQGWDQWCGDILEMLRVCESREAIDRVQNSNRALLTALQRERVELYATLGQAIAARREELARGKRARASKPAPASATAPAKPRPRRARAKAEGALADA